VLTDDLALGGLQRQLALTATNLPEKWDVRCLSIAGGPSAELLIAGGVALDIVERRWRYDPIPFLRLWATVARWRPHLVHSWGYMTTLAGYPAFRALGIPFIDGTIRTGDISLTRRSWCRLGFDRATLVVANSRSGLISARVPLERGRVIPNGFDFSRIPARSPDRTDHRFTVVMAARMHPHKDFSTLIEGIRKLVHRIGESALRCVLLGEGPDNERLRSEGRDLIDAKVMELRYVGNVIPQLLTSDCGVMMTARHQAVEGCSNAVLEYMACGLPVVCSGGGGADELVSHGETGFLVAPGDSEELANYLQWIYSHSEVARKMGDKGREVVRHDYSLEAMIRATEDAYAEALARG